MALSFDIQGIYDWYPFAWGPLSYEPFYGSKESRSAAIGDLNGDGFSDLVVVNSDRTFVSVMLGTGTGEFELPARYETGSLPYSVALGDLNEDGILDLAVNSTDAVHNYGSPSISVLLGTGTGAFGARTDYATLGRTSSAVLGDLNNDGNLDLVAANWGWSTVSVQLGTGQGTFSTPTEYRMDADTYTVALGDLNGDGNLDIAAAGPNSGAIAYRLGDGTGTFGDPTAGSPMFGSNWAYTVLINDLNGDGTSDLVSVGDMRGGYMIAPTLQVPPTSE